MNTKHITVDEAAEYLEVTRQTLDRMRYHGDGPALLKITARAIRYRKTDIDRWLEERVYRGGDEYRNASGGTA